MADLNRRAAIRINRDEVARTLQLPEGVEVLAIDSTNDPVGFTVIVTGDVIPEVPADCYAPFAQKVRYVSELPGGPIETITYQWPEAF